MFATPLHVYHWHREGFKLPAGAELLATGASFPHQAYRYGGNVFGVQFHPEVDRVILDTWLVESAHELTAPGAQSAAEQRDHHARHDAVLDRWFDGFLDEWLQASAPHSVIKPTQRQSVKNIPRGDFRQPAPGLKGATSVVWASGAK